MSLLRSTFIALSTQMSLRRFSESSAAGKRMSSRFVAGMTIDEVLEAADSLNAQGIAATLDSLGENVSTPEEAEHSAGIYHRLLDAIGERGLNANVSVKLTQMGMDLDAGIAETIVDRLVTHAGAVDSFVRVDMEGSPYTQATLDLVQRIHAKPENGNRIGVVIQAYLMRSEADIRGLIAAGHAYGCARAPTRSRRRWRFPKRPRSTRTSFT